MGEKTARWLTACGWIAAGLGAFGGFYITITNPMNNASGYLVMAEAVIFLGLAYGIFRGSRICALVAMALFLIDRVGMYRFAMALQAQRGGNIMAGFWPTAVFFTILYLLGLLGTVAMNRRNGTAKPRP
jgi:hypothetical protein